MKPFIKCYIQRLWGTEKKFSSNYRKSFSRIKTITRRRKRRADKISISSLTD